jgi:hypothetical protein
VLLPKAERRAQALMQIDGDRQRSWLAARFAGSGRHAPNIT